MSTTQFPFLDKRSLKRYPNMVQHVFAPIKGVTDHPIYVYWIVREEDGWLRKVSYKIQNWTRWCRLGSSFPFQPTQFLFGEYLVQIYANLWTQPHLGFPVGVSLTWQKNPTARNLFRDGEIHLVSPEKSTQIK